jgi:hypothetical protein
VDFQTSGYLKIGGEVFGEMRIIRGSLERSAAGICHLHANPDNRDLLFACF